ncbi:MAG: alpha-amylase family glycosyl hydrolase [Pseudomonadota bacterium]|jgi:cyclomaltodextrinase
MHRAFARVVFRAAILFAASAAGAAETMPAEPNLFATPRDRALAPVLAAREADWRIGPVVYQVLVDRFAPSVDLDAKRHHYAAPRRLREWTDEPARGTRDDALGLWSHELDFWGGDLESLHGKLDYIEGLGVDVLYLNPIHQALTNHKYDAQDYTKVSAEYGTRADVKRLADDLHGRGMRLVLDGVLNHMGRTSPMFQDALANPASPWRDYFVIGPQWQLGYRAWWDVANLPDVNWGNPKVREWLYGSPDAVVPGWFREGVDGWRLDVAYDLGFTYLTELTQALHAAKPGSLVLGEVYNYPPDWVDGPLDGILNITASEAIFQMATGRLGGRHAGDIVERLVADTDYEGLLRSWIVLDNHDKPRLASWIPGAEAQRFAQVLQFTLPGAPNLYYGVELGLEGPEDPSNRGPMRWERASADNPQLAFVKHLTALRREMRALRIGEFRRLDAERLFAFSRHTDRIAELAIVLANPGDAPVDDFVMTRESKLANNEILRCALTGAEVRLSAGALRVTVPAKTVWLLRPVLRKPELDYEAYKRVQ